MRLSQHGNGSTMRSDPAQLDVNGKVKDYSDRHSPADGTLPEVPTADYTASIASLEGLFRTTETSSAHRRNLDAGWKVDQLKMASHLSGGKASTAL